MREPSSGGGAWYPLDSDAKRAMSDTASQTGAAVALPRNLPKMDSDTSVALYRAICDEDWFVP